MCEQYHIVPWYNSEEWHEVYHQIYSENLDKKDALNLLLMWKARCPSLPSGIESTLSLLQVHIQDVKCKDDDITQDQILRLAYSSAVMRFVNHMLDTETAKGTSLYNAAKNAGVPDWIVDLRHDTAHSNNLPSLPLLRNACVISLQWLQKNYWDKHKECIQDYTAGQQVHSSTENKIAAMIHICSCLSICTHSKIKKLADITDPGMQEDIVNDARDLFADQIDLSNLKTVSISSLINLINIHAKKILKSGNTTFYVNQALLGEESLFLSLELLEYLSRNDFNKKNKLSTSYVKCFEVLLTFLHTHDLILEFILSLVKMTHNDDYTKKTKLAALWIREILTALKKSKQFVERANKMNSEGVASKKKKDLKVLYHHWFPNEKLDGLILDLQKAVPGKLLDINFIQPIISSYNPYLTYFVNELLNLVDPNLPKSVLEKICMLAKLISAPETFPLKLSPVKIYTVEDLKLENMPLGNESDDEPKKSEACQNFSEELHVNGIWKLASKQNWQQCPIGKVPWHHQSLDIINMTM